MSLLNVLTLPVVLILDDINVAFEFLVEAAKATLLECDEVIDVDEMVSQGHLVLFLGFIQVTIVHLHHSFFSINLSVVILLVDLDVFLKLLSLCETQDLSPVSEDLHSVKMSHLLFLLHLGLEMLPLHLHSLHFILNITKSSCLVLNLDCVPLVFISGHATTLDVFT